MVSNYKIKHMQFAIVKDCIFFQFIELTPYMCPIMSPPLLGVFWSLVLEKALSL